MYFGVVVKGKKVAHWVVFGVNVIEEAGKTWDTCISVVKSENGQNMGLV